MTTDSLETRVKGLEELVSRLNNNNAFGELRYGQPLTPFAQSQADITTLQSQVPLTGYITSDFTQASTTTLANVTDGSNTIKVTLAANSIYRIECYFLYNSGATPDYKFSLTGPAGITGYNQFFAIAVGGVTAIYTNQFFSTATSLEGTGGDFPVHIWGTAVTTNAGDLTLQAAQNTSNASNTITRAGSMIIAWKIN